MRRAGDMAGANSAMEDASAALAKVEKEATMRRLQHLLTNLQKSPLAMMLVAALLVLALIQTEVRLQVAAFWETHPIERYKAADLMESPADFAKAMKYPPPK